MHTPRALAAILTLTLLPVLALLLASCSPTEEDLALPAAKKTGTVSLEAALAKRQSARTFARSALTREQIAQLLWAAQGVNRSGGRRTAPSAGALYPLEVYVVTHKGVFRYQPKEHRLAFVREGDVRGALHSAALSQDAVKGAPAVFVISAEYARTRRKYGGRAERYAHLEAGHAAQNLLLQAAALDLAAVPIGAFKDAAVQQALGCSTEHAPLYVIPVGRRE